jgi:hypothetical protein
MTPAKDRKAAERQRRKDAGLVRCEVWVKPEHVAEIKRLADDLSQEQPIDPESWAAFILYGKRAARAQIDAAIEYEAGLHPSLRKMPK